MATPMRPTCPVFIIAKTLLKGLDTMDKLTDPARAADYKVKMVSEGRAYLTNQSERAEKIAASSARIAAETAARVAAIGGKRPSGVPDVEKLPNPPFWGWRTLPDIALDDLLPLIDYNTLYRLHWGAGSDKKRGAGSYEKIVKETFEPVLERLVAEARTRWFLTAQSNLRLLPVYRSG